MVNILTSTSANTILVPGRGATERLQSAPGVRALTIALLLAFAPALVSQRASAGIVVLNLDMPLDQVARDRPSMKVGDHHRARIFYDDSTIDPVTHRVRVIHMEHWMGRWTPEAVGDPTMPMGDAWLDLSSQPYRYHYLGAAVIGEPVVVEFSDTARRMTIRKQSGDSVIVSAPYTVYPEPVLGVALVVATSPAITMLQMKVTLDEVKPGQLSKVGDVDQLRLVYDRSAIDPNTLHVKLLNMQHFVTGKYLPTAPDPVTMPMNDAWLDLSSKPYRLHFKASVVHGQPIIIDADESSRRLSIRPQDDPAATIESGLYEIDAAPITGPEAVAAGTTPPMPPEKSH
jgi:hypothetical protein